MSTASLEEFSGVVESIHAAALEPARWPVALERIAHLHRSDKALLSTPARTPSQGGISFPFGLSEATLLEWERRYTQHDVWARRGAELDLPAGRAVTDTDLVPDQELLDSTFYREFLSRLDIGRLCTGMVFDTGNAQLPGTRCSIYATRAHVFEDTDRRLHSLTLAHLSHSLAISAQLRDADLRVASTLAALDRLPGNILLLDRRGGVTFANPAAMRLLHAADGLALHAAGAARDAPGRLQASRSCANAELTQAIARAVDASPIGTRQGALALKLPRPSGKAALVVQLSPLPESSALAHADRYASAIVFVTDPSARAHIDAELSKRIYGFTPAECRLANNLLGGETLQEIAERTGVSTLTLRKQLQTLFGKTHTCRQSELLKLLMSFATPQ